MGFISIEVVWAKHPLYGDTFGEWTDHLFLRDEPIDYALVARLKKLGAIVWGHTDGCKYTPSRHLL